MVLLKRNTNDTAITMGQNLAASWTNFVKASPKFNKDIPYVFYEPTPKTLENSEPLNNFLMAKDTVVILKRLFEGCTKDELPGDTEWMESFYGSQEAAKAVLNGLIGEQWDNV